MLWLVSALLAANPLWAQVAGHTDIAHEPLMTMSEAQAKPNMMILLDDSRSMNYDYMPDDASYNANRFGRYTSQCNGVYYNPDIVYEPPVHADGSSYPNARFEAALMDGFASLNAQIKNLSGNSFIDNQAVNLSNNTRQTVPLQFRATTRAVLGAQTFDVQSNSTQALGHASFAVGTRLDLQGNGARNMSGVVTAWTYTPSTDRGLLSIDVRSVGGANLSAANTWDAVIAGQFYFQYRGHEPALAYAYDSRARLINNLLRQQCNQNRTARRNTNANSNVFESVSVTSTSPEAIKTNYANWYSYYRTRELLMRTAMGKAINQLDETYRLGFMTINQPDMTRDRLEFRNIEDFTARKKADIYDSLYLSSTVGSTPLRLALSRAGQYYANKVRNQGYDPIQYACQRNYVMVTTDGYWNSSSGENLSGRSINTLADVAAYYYNTDLRTPELNNCVSGSSGLNVCENIVPPNGRDDAAHQHMTTYAIGMGVNGTLPYSKTYLTDATGTYADILAGRLNWPTPSQNSPTAVDDLWHAAVNGRGIYYSAQNATELAESITGVIEAMQQATGAASGTSTSTLELVQGEDNIAYEASYTTLQWTGDVKAHAIDANTGMPDEDAAPLWSARNQLDQAVPAQRQIFFHRAGALAQFDLNNLPDEQKNLFLNRCGAAAAARLSQCQNLSTQAQERINQGDLLVNFLRGDRRNEASNASSPLFRTRVSVLGDIVNSKPIHVGAPPFMYGDAGYTEFKAQQANRQRVIYVGANDGMLHALDAATGNELWAYIPTAVMPNLYKLADSRYGTVNHPHQYFVDGKTVQGDVYINNQWRTILVGGLNAGGRAYYALDITDPSRPSFLWEFSNPNLGQSFSDPIITKLQDGSWTVAFGSGYNNTNPGDNRGRLFIVAADTGQLLRNIATSAGSASQSAGLAKINVWRSSNSNNTAERFYAGDLLGNIWRFDVDGRYAPFNSALLLAQMRDANGMPQPITTEIKLRDMNKKTMLGVATGRLLGTTDISHAQTQSFAVFEDPLLATGLGVLRNHQKMKKQVISGLAPNQPGQATILTEAEADLLQDHIGWWVDFPSVGERVNIPMEWLGGALIVATAIPEGDVCKSGGSAWIYHFSLETGEIEGFELSSSSLIVGLSVVTNDTGHGIVKIRDSKGDSSSWLPRQPQPGTGGGDISPRRVGWRELY